MKQKCLEVLEHVYLFLDGEGLSESQRIEIEAHLEDCGPCFEQFGFYQASLHITARLRGTSLCPDDLKAKVARLLEQA
jgi:mycothiol system anti-sigma-R factor